MSQSSNILSHLKYNGSITPLEALQEYGCFRLGARVYDLRAQGHDIETEWLELANGKRVARYRLNRSEITAR